MVYPKVLFPPNFIILPGMQAVKLHILKNGMLWTG